VAVHAIEPTGIYFPDQFRSIFRLKQTTLRREVSKGRLRIARRAGRYYLLGEWILEWLRGGELRRPTPRVAAEAVPHLPYERAE
jgi:hypothetical protein